jgi:N-acetylglutamate synthase-like GNAT family acetyltransferase
MSEDSTVRLARTNDIPFIYSLMNRRHTEVGYTPRGALLERAERGCLLLVVKNDQEAGFLNYTHRIDRTTHVSQVAISEELWRDGLGTKVMTALLIDAVRAGSRAVTLQTARELFANNFWPTLGFETHCLTRGRRRWLWKWSLDLTQRPHPLPLHPPTPF